MKRHPAYPIAQGRTVKFHAFAGHRWPIAGRAADGRSTWRPGHVPVTQGQAARARSAATASVPGRSVSHARQLTLGRTWTIDLEVRRHVFQHLALIGADQGQMRAAAGGADAGGFMLHPLTRQMIRQRLAHRMRFFLPRCGCRRRCSRRSVRSLLSAWPSSRSPISSSKLLDVAVQFLRRTAEAGTPEHRQLSFQFLDMQRSGRKARHHVLQSPFATLPATRWRRPAKRQNPRGEMRWISDMVLSNTTSRKTPAFYGVLQPFFHAIDGRFCTSIAIVRRQSIPSISN